MLAPTKRHRNTCLGDSGMKTLLSIMIFMGLTNRDILVLIVYRIGARDKLWFGEVQNVSRETPVPLSLVSCFLWELVILE